MTTTTDLSLFGYRELEEVRELLDAYKSYHDKTVLFDSEGVHPMFNMNSGCVFLTNSEYQVALMDGRFLRDFISCPECGEEGIFYTKEEFPNNNNDGFSNECCKEYLKEF